MKDEVLTRERRDTLLARLRQLDVMLYPPDDTTQAPRGAERARIKDDYFKVLGEYFDRLPRVVMSVCPFTGEPLMRSFDPFGLDGPWWHKDRLVEVEEPDAPSAFKVLLGALHLGSRIPTESIQEVIPGPEVPFVVSRLMGLPGMIAVVSQLKLDTGDTAYPVAYYSRDDIPPVKLHQHWLRQDLWFKTASGDASWLIANDTWEFELDAWVAKKQLGWVVERDGVSQVLSADSGEPCPFLNLPGERLPQVIVGGERDFDELPNGVPFNPFKE